MEKGSVKKKYIVYSQYQREGGGREDIIHRNIHSKCTWDYIVDLYFSDYRNVRLHEEVPFQEDFTPEKGFRWVEEAEGDGEVEVKVKSKKRERPDISSSIEDLEKKIGRAFLKYVTDEVFLKWLTDLAKHFSNLQEKSITILKNKTISSFEIEENISFFYDEVINLTKLLESQLTLQEKKIK